MPKSVKGVMREWKAGALHSGSSKGPVVTSQKQAVAIALSEALKHSAEIILRQSVSIYTGSVAS